MEWNEKRQMKSNEFERRQRKRTNSGEKMGSF